MEEKRQAKRVPFSGPIEQMVLHCSSFPRLDCDDEFVAATAINISSGGLACEAATKVEPLTQVYFMFALPAAGGTRRIKGEAYVVNSNYDGHRCVFGVHFSDLSAEDQAAIDAFVNSQDPR